MSYGSAANMRSATNDHISTAEARKEVASVSLTCCQEWLMLHLSAANMKGVTNNQLSTTVARKEVASVALTRCQAWLMLPPSAANRKGVTNNQLSTTVAHLQADRHRQCHVKHCDHVECYQ